MRRKLVCVLTAVLLCLTFALSACGGNANERGDGAYHTVTFDSQGGSAVESQQVLDGNPVRVPSTPANGELLFQGWFVSANAGAEGWNFDTGRISGDMTLYAHWAVDTSEPTKSITYEKTADNAGYIVTGAGQEAEIVIPETHDDLPVVEIGESAFAYSGHKSEILSVTIPDSVAKIGLNAFHNQSALKAVNIGTGSGLKSIGNNAFSGNSALKAFYLPAGATSLGDSVFNNCGALDTFTVANGNTAYSGEGNCLIDRDTHTIVRGTNHSEIPATVAKIGEAAFRMANGITELYIPRSVTGIEKYAFAYSTLTTIEYEGSEDEWENVSKGAMWNLRCTLEIKYNAVRDEETTNILVAYFSATGTTKGVAERIAEAADGVLYEIVPEVPYTADDLDYGDSTTRATREQRDASVRPQIDGGVANMEEYDVIFLGYPIWWGKAPKIIYTFLESYEFAGKTIVPFCTSGSSGIEGSLSDLKAIATGATWLAGRRLEGGSANAIQDWIDGLGY